MTYARFREHRARFRANLVGRSDADLRRLILWAVANLRKHDAEKLEVLYDVTNLDPMQMALRLFDLRWKPIPPVEVPHDHN